MTLEQQFEEVLYWRREVVGETGPTLASGKMVTEASEVLDLFIKATDWPGREVDEEHLKQEIGDVLVTVVGVCDETELTMEECIDAAMTKNASDDWQSERGL